MRKVLFWIHLVLGVAAGAVILVMSATGVLLAFQRQILERADRLTVVQVGKPLPLSQLIAKARTADSSARPLSVTRRSDPGAPVTLAFSGGVSRTIDPYTGQMLSSPSPKLRTFFRTVTGVHRWFALEGVARTRARKITGAANLLFLGLILTGPFLWFPKRMSWSRLSSVLVFRRGLHGKAREFNWHHVLGIWSLLPLFVLVASGVVISYPWATALVYRAVGEDPPRTSRQSAQRGRANETKLSPASASSLSGVSRSSSISGASPASSISGASPASPGTSADMVREILVTSDPLAVFDAVEAGALAYVSGSVPRWRTMTIPLNSDGPLLSVNIDEGNGGQPQLRRAAKFRTTDGQPESVETFGNQSTGRQLRSILRFAHTGEVLGTSGQTIAALASLAAVVLVWTGLALSFRRLLAWRRRQARSVLSASRRQP